MNKMTFLCLVLLIKTSVGIKAQESFWNSSAAYLGQTPPSDTPRLFASTLLVPDTGMALGRVAFSPDGKEFYYGYALHWFDSKGAAVKYFKYSDNKWNGPLVLNEQFSYPTFSIDGKTLYFPGDDSLGGLLWQAKRTKNGWTKPSIAFRKKYMLYNFMPTNSGNMYIGTNGTWGTAADYSTYDIGLMKVSKQDTILQNLGTPLNTDSALMVIFL